ncbi:MAG: N-acyl homoserine lactonase family protein [Leucobacter sp.]
MNATVKPYEVLAVRMGTRQSAKSDVFLNFGLYQVPDAPVHVDYYFWVLRNDDRVLVVDTGFSETGGTRRGRSTLIPPAEALQRLGIDPATVSGLVLTHGHYDHIGNIDLFSNSQIFMAAAEYEFWTSPIAERRQFSYYSEEREVQLLREAQEQGRLHLFEGESVPAPGVRLSQVGGHTPGQAMVYVESHRGTVLLASDALHFYEELDQDMPFTAICDLPDMYRAFDRIRSEAGAAFDVLIAGHDRRVLEEYPACGELPEGTGVVISASG